MLQKLVKGLWLYFVSDEKIKIFRASREADTTFLEEEELRGKVVQILKDASRDLEKAGELTKKYINSLGERKTIDEIINFYLYISSIHKLRHTLNLHMSNLDYPEAKKICEEGIIRARMQLDQSNFIRNIREREKKQYGYRADVNLFAGHLREIEAYKILDKPFWDMRNIDYLQTARLFEEVIDILERAVPLRESDARNIALSDLTDVDRALMYLLRFSGKPKLDKIASLAAYRELEQKSTILKRILSTPETRGISKRKNRLIRLLQQARLYTYKIACWNIFSEMREYANIVETFVSKNRNIRIFMIAKFTELENRSNDIDTQKQYQKRREKYENPANLITIDRFVDDIERYIPNLLPATVGNQKLSIVVAKNLFHWIKHPGDQPRGMNEFTEKLINIAVTNQKSLQTLVVDTNKFIKKLDSTLLETYM